MINLILSFWIISFIVGTIPEIRYKINLYENSTFNSTLTDLQMQGKELLTAFNSIDLTCFSIFLIELLIRFVVCAKKLKFVKNLLNLIDMLTIILYFTLYFVSLSYKDASILIARRILTSFRILLLLKVTRFSWRFKSLGLTLQKSFIELLLLFFFLVLSILIVATILFHTESGVKNTQFTSIPTTFWYAIVTMTTVKLKIFLNIFLFLKIFIQKRLDMAIWFVSRIFLG